MVLKIENLSHKYSSSWALRDINVEIDQPGIVGLLGSNGAGKSTAMNIICGTLNQTEGNVFINGIDLRKHPVEAKKQIGFLPQTAPLYTDLTVDEYLWFCADLRLIEKQNIKTAISEVKSRCGINHVSSRLIKNLSGGYRQRVGIAQAIVHKPSLVVMDEPTNGLDPNQMIEARKLIKEIAEEHTVLFSSHVLSEVNLLCREVIMIEGGRIVFSDTMDAFNHYAPSTAIMIRVDSLPPKANVENIPGVTQVDYLSDHQARIQFDGNEDEITSRLIAASTAGGWRLKEIAVDKAGLDEVFKYLSNNGSQGSQ